jgi:hypothetical protein
MNDDVKGMWKAAVIPYFEELSDFTCSKRGKAQNMATRKCT